MPLDSPQISHGLTGIERGLRDERPVTNCPSHGTALQAPILLKRCLKIQFILHRKHFVSITDTMSFLLFKEIVGLILADPSMRLWPPAFWDCGFESRRGHGYLFLGRVLCVGQITRPEEFYREWCIWLWSWSLDNEAPSHWRGCCAMGGGEVPFWESYETQKYPQWEESTVCVGRLGGTYGYKYALTGQNSNCQPFRTH